MDQSAAAFKKAISLLPSVLSPADEVLKKQYEEGIEEAENAKQLLRKPANDSFTRVPAARVKQEELPWNRALTMEADLVATQRPDSSVSFMLWQLGSVAYLLCFPLA